MGADTFFAAVPAPIDNTGQVWYPVNDRGLEILHQRVAGLSDQVLTACSRQVLLHDDREAILEMLHDAVDNVLGEAPYWCPRVDRGRSWIVSGGISYGESPWDYDAITALGMSGVTELPLDGEAIPALEASSRLLAPSLVNLLVAQLETWLLQSGMGVRRRAVVLAALQRSVEADEAGISNAIAIALRTRWGSCVDVDLDELLGSR